MRGEWDMVALDMDGLAGAWGGVGWEGIGRLNGFGWRLVLVQPLFMLAALWTNIRAHTHTRASGLGVRLEVRRPVPRRPDVSADGEVFCFFLFICLCLSVTVLVFVFAFVCILASSICFCASACLLAAC